MKKIFLILLWTLGNSSILLSQTVRVGVMNYELDSNNHTAKVVNCIITGDVFVPEQVTYNNMWFMVTAIGERAFYNDKSLKSIVLPKTLLSIEEKAFWGCSKLTQLVIPHNVNKIGDSAFANCLGLLEIYCLPLRPIMVKASVFENVNVTHCKLYVLSNSIDAYKDSNVWRNFVQIQTIAIR